MSAGRQMGGHLQIHSLNEDGSWKDLTKTKNLAQIFPMQDEVARKTQ
jgi:hypothetical protein